MTISHSMSAVVGESSPSKAPGLAIHLFGQIQVLVHGRPLPHLRSRKGLHLLALLALRNGRSVDRSWLAGTLWPDHEEADAARSMRQSLHDLRRALSTESWRLLRDSPGTLRLDLSGAHLDVIAFDMAIARGDTTSLMEAVRLYTGPLVEGCAEEWALQDRRRREQDYVAALEMLAANARSRGDHGGAASFLRSAIGVDPYREDLHRALMERLMDAGDAAEALLVYNELRSLLWREMSAAPDAATTDLFRRIRDQVTRSAKRPRTSCSRTPVPAGDSSGAGRRQLPVPLTRLIGREEAVREILCLLSGARLVTLLGAGGIGKTRLALEVAAHLNASLEAGAHFVNLAPLTDSTLVAEAARDALGLLRGDGRQDVIEHLKDHLADRTLLLVLDNCEHLPGACATLAATLLESCPGLRIVTTSRHALGLRGETAWRVPALALPPAVDDAAKQGRREAAGSTEAFSAVTLFVERARAADSSFALTDQNAPHIVRICRRLDGIPLAIELAAARVRSLPVDEIADRLRDDLGLLRARGPAVQPRHHGLETAFQWSWDLLSEEERSALARLSVFSGGWSLSAAEDVCAGEQIEQEDVVELLASLVDKSLVALPCTEERAGTVLRSTPRRRYLLMETVRQFASERLQDGPEYAAIRRRHRDYYLQWAESVLPKLRGPGQAEWFDRLEEEHDNLRAAIEWCRTCGDVNKEFRLLIALSRFWDTRGYLREGRAHMESALERAGDDAPADLRPELLSKVGWICVVQADREAARKYFAEALEMYRAVGNERYCADLLNYLACLHSDDGNLADALPMFEEAVAICRRLWPSAGLPAALNNLGGALLTNGNPDSARAYLEECASLCHANEGLEQLFGKSAANLAVVALRTGRPEEARIQCDLCVRAFAQCGALTDLPASLDLVAAVSHAEGDAAGAARLLGAAEALAAAAGLPSAKLTAPERERAHQACRESLGAAAYDSALAEGRQMDLSQAVAFSLREETS